MTLLDLRKGTRRLLGRGGGRVHGAGFSPDGTMLVTTGDDGDVVVWRAASGELRERLEGHSGPRRRTGVHPRRADGLHVCARRLRDRLGPGRRPTPRPAIRLGAARGGRARGRVRRNGALAGRARSLRGSPDGRIVALGLDGRPRWGTTVWTPARVAVYRQEFAKQSPNTPKQAVEEYINGWVQSLAVSPDGRLVAAAAHNREVALIEAAGRRVLRRWRASRYQWINAVAFAADGDTLVTGGDDGRVLWDVRTVSSGRSSTFPESRAPDGAAGSSGWRSLSPDADELAIFSSPWTPETGASGCRVGDRGVPPRVGVYSVATGRPLWERDADRINVWARPVLAASHDWSLLATGGFVRDVRLWRTRTGGAWASHFRRARRSSSRPGSTRRVGCSSRAARTARFGCSTSTRSVRWERRFRESVVSGRPRRSARRATPCSRFPGSGRGWIWDISAERLREQACRTANRALTSDEWRRYLGRAYAPTCRG